MSESGEQGAQPEIPGAPKSTSPEAEEKTQDHIAHRSRLRARFINAGAGALADYEMLELILFGPIPRRDVKPLAKEFLRKFGGFADVIATPAERLREVDGVGDAVIAALKTVEAAAMMLSKARIVNRPELSSWEALLDYCAVNLSRAETEEFRVLFLDRKNNLLADEAQTRGTVDHTPVYPREVVRRALALNACALILVHNHPSGDPTPSRADIAMTREIVTAAKALGIDVHDHLVIGSGRHASFKALGLL